MHCKLAFNAYVHMRLGEAGRLGKAPARTPVRVSGANANAEIPRAPQGGSTSWRLLMRKPVMVESCPSTVESMTPRATKFDNPSQGISENGRAFIGALPDEKSGHA